MNKNITSVAFFGTPDFAVPSLRALIENKHYQVSVVVTQPDKPAGRGRSLKQSPVKITSLENNIKVLEPEKINNNFINLFKSLDIDVAVVVAYGKILPNGLLKIPQFGFVNVHPSLLPQYRGSSPMQSTILNNDSYTGISIMLLDEKMDHGPILMQKKLKLPNIIDFPTLHNKMALKGSKLLVEALNGYIRGSIVPVEQNHTKATFTKLIQKKSGHIDWSKDAIHIDAHIRAFSGWPGAYTEFKNKKLEIIKASAVDMDNADVIDIKKQPGLVVKINNKILVCCGDNSFIELLEIKLAGKTKTLITDFIRGYSNFIGSVLG